MNDEGPNHQLVMLLTRHQRRIFSYIYSLVPHRQDAEDILQETCSTICEKFHEFELDTDFAAWACKIAWWRIRASRQKFARSKIIFDERILEAVSLTATSMTDELDHRHEALESCLEKLPPRDRNLITGCYSPDGSMQEAARASGRTLVAAYKAIARVRKQLLDCVTLHLQPGLTPPP